MAGVLSTAERVSPGHDQVVDPAASASALAAMSPSRFALPATADIRVVRDVLGLCRSALEAEGDVIVDCGDVERIDAATLQCLGALHRSLAEADRLLTFAGPTDAFCQAVQVLGFDALFSPGATVAA